MEIVAEAGPGGFVLSARLAFHSDDGGHVGTRDEALRQRPAKSQAIDDTAQRFSATFAGRVRACLSQLTPDL